jgi:NhaA family Na+:H+ antiporter
MYNAELWNDFKQRKASGLILIGCTLISLILANSILANNTFNTWHLNFGGQSLEYWINDGLMTIFFY